MQAVTKGVHILSMLLFTQRKYKKDYSYPSQETAMSNMEKYQRLKISRATLNRWMRVIDDSKYLIRQRRIKRHPQYGLMLKSTLYKITIKGYRLLGAFGVDVSKEIAAYERWLEEIHPERKIKKTKKMLSEAKQNAHHQETIRKILTQLGENLAA